MNVQTKVKESLQTYQLVAYKRALHPDLFAVKMRRSIKHNLYGFEAWLMPGSHVLRFQHKGFCGCELVTDREDGLPAQGAIASFPCAGERDFEHVFPDSDVTYVTTVQTETLSESLYTATYVDMVRFAQETESVAHAWVGADGGRCLSVLDIQRYPTEIHTQSYHLQSAGGLVLRTQTIFGHG